jgi:predicted Zn-dependent peptidase
MRTETIEYKKLDEVMHIYTHNSGLKAFVIPKKGYYKKHAAFATHYGSINSEFIAPGDEKSTVVPDGVAHFLEHKLFEQEDGSVMDKFSALGSNPNAYTGFNNTVYLFSATEKFYDNFKLLVDFVQNPHITDESVEKEKGIIAQEIRMYQDNPNWRVFFNLLGAFYMDNPVRLEISGDIQSISQINRDVLYKCYNTFYHPSNMMILVVGDVEPNEIFRITEEGIKSKEKKGEIKRIFPRKETQINKEYVEQKLSVSIPLFQMGFVDMEDTGNGTAQLEHEVSVKILLEMLLGRSSELYNKLYAEGLINNTFDLDYTIEENYAFSMFGGESSNPEKVKEIFLNSINQISNKGISRTEYEMARRALMGRYIRRFNSVENISHGFISVCFKGVSLFDYFDVYDKMSFEKVEESFQRHFNPKNFAMSLIKPI